MNTIKKPKWFLALLTLLPLVALTTAMQADVALDQQGRTNSAPAAQTAPAAKAPVTAPSKFDSDLYKVDKKLISSGQVGEIAKYSLKVSALRDIKEVRMLESLPEGLEYVEASPAPTQTAEGYFWSWPSMAAGSSKEIIVTVRPRTEGWLVTNTKMSVMPVIELPLFAGAPKLQMTKTGPATIELGEPVIYKVTVTNSGNAPATDVVVVDNLPTGLADPNSDNKTLTYKLGTIAPGESKSVDIPLKATGKGDWENTASLTASQIKTPIVSRAGRLTIVESKIALTKTGTERRFVFTEASYVITVRNAGTTTLQNIKVTDEVPEGTKFASASDEGKLVGNNVEWTVAKLAPGESVKRTVNLVGLKPGTLSAPAVAQAGSLRDTASATTIWEGAPGVLTELVDDVDPVQVGEFTTYTVTITNQSPHRDLTSDAVVELTSGMSAVEVSKEANATVDGQRVIVKSISLKPNQKYTFKIKAKATAAGIQGARLEFGTGFLPRPSVKEETTYVY